MTHLVFCAIDTPDLSKAINLTKTIAPITGAIKLGLEFWGANGISGVKEVKSNAGNAKIFLDLKLHDIPNTVSGAINAVLGEVGVDYLTIHTSGGFEMMRAAKNAAQGRAKILGVSVLTSLDANALNEIGQGNDTQGQVIKLSKLAQKAGLDGVVCSALEVCALRQILGTEIELIVPGIRPKGAKIQDQARIATPSDAIKNGATHLVVGRPITSATDPSAAASSIVGEI